MFYKNLDMLSARLHQSANSIEFSDVIELIDAKFTFTATAFTNGEVTNEANQNNGSCKLLALGQYMELNKEQTLALFGNYYREDVLGNPGGSDHANIRNFIKTGHDGVHFEAFPLKLK